MYKMSIISHITSFLSNSSLKTLEQGQHALLPLRHIMWNGFTTSQSRSLWYALMIYRYKSDHPSCDELWTAARECILTTLRKEDNQAIGMTYLKLFSQWKEKDLHSFIVEMATFYAQLIDIKDAIERTHDPTTIYEWRESYMSLIAKVRNSAKRLHFLEKMEQMVVDIQRARQQYVYDMMRRAYWDMMEEELAEQNTTILICHMNELAELLMAIAPNGTEPITMESTINQIETHTFGKDEAWELFQWCMGLVKEWDSVEKECVYEEAVSSMESQRDESWAKWVRVLMEKSTVLIMDLRTRKELWRLLLTTERTD
jgi:hypothetical protein